MPRTVSEFLWALESETLAESHDPFAPAEDHTPLQDIDDGMGAFSLPSDNVDFGAGSVLSLF